MRWQLAILYIASLSAVLTLLSLLLYAEVERILVTNVANQLSANAGPVMNSGQLHTVQVTATGHMKLPFHMMVPPRGTGYVTTICKGGPAACTNSDVQPPELTSTNARTSAAPAVGPNSEAQPPEPTSTPAPTEPDLTLDRYVATGIVARFVDVDGHVRGQTGSTDILRLVGPPDARTVGMLNQYGRTQSYTTGRPPNRVEVLLEPVVTQAGTPGVLQMGASLAAVDRFLAMFHASLVLGVLAALGTGTAVGLFATRRLFAPLDRMGSVSRTVAGGDLSRRFRGRAGSSDVRTLAKSFNHMIDRLEASLRTQQQFSADAAHELRTPLTALGGSVELLLLGADEGDPRRTQKVLRSMHLEIERLTRLVNDLLQLARMDSQAPLQRQVMDVSALATEVAAELRLITPNTPVELLSDGPLWVQGDHDRLKQVLLNIGDNALKFTSAGGRITITVGRAGDHVRIRVIDTGPGIAAEDLAHVFDRFYRSDRSRARSSGGMGLGLAIAKVIVDAHRGTITASSTPGHGATFTVSLPLVGRMPEFVTSPRADLSVQSGAKTPPVAAIERRASGTGQPVAKPPTWVAAVQPQPRGTPLPGHATEAGAPAPAAGVK